MRGQNKDNLQEWHITFSNTRENYPNGIPQVFSYKFGVHEKDKAAQFVLEKNNLLNEENKFIVTCKVSPKIK